MKNFYCHHSATEKVKQYLCPECQLLICPVCKPNHNHTNAIRMIEGMFGKHEVKPCFFCGEKDENRLAVENMGLGFCMGGNDYSFCVKCLREKSAYSLVEEIAKDQSYQLPLIMRGFDMSNHILLRKESL